MTFFWTFLYLWIDSDTGRQLGWWLVTVLMNPGTRGGKSGRTLYAWRNHVVPFFLLLTNGIQSAQVPHKPSQMSTLLLPSILLVSWGGSNARPVAALTP